jgi:hypothetical protein
MESGPRLAIEPAHRRSDPGEGDGVFEAPECEDFRPTFAGEQSAMRHHNYERRETTRVLMIEKAKTSHQVTADPPRDLLLPRFLLSFR